MTRLVKQDLEGLCAGLPGYDQELQQKTGLTLRQIACRAAGIPEKVLVKRLVDSRVAVVPVTSGQGIVPLFTRSVQGIVEYLGCRTVVTRETDVAGMAEGIQAGAGVLFMADDRRFIALNIRNGVMADNGVATGRGFAAALEAMAGGLEKQKVLVLGAGDVGISAIDYLSRRGAMVAVYDPDCAKTRLYQSGGGVRVEAHLPDALAGYRYILDASPQGGFIGLADLQPGVMLAIPGMPSGLTAGAYQVLEARVVHDPLQIGVATMLAQVISPGHPD